MNGVICLDYVNSYAILNMNEELKTSAGVMFLYQTENYLNITVYIKNLTEDLSSISITAYIGTRLNFPIYYDNGKLKTSIISKDYMATDFVGDEVKILAKDEVLANGIIIKDVRNYDYHYKKI